MQITRRGLGRLVFTALPAASLTLRGDSKIQGVMLGAQSYSFRDRPFEAMIEGMQKAGLTYLEMWSGHVEPPRTPGEDNRKHQEKVREWRLNPPLDELRQARRKLDQAGIALWAFNYSMRTDFSDREIANGFEIAKALGVTRLTSSSNVSTAKKVDPYARKAKVYVGMHNHSRIVADEFATPDDFAAALAGNSEYIAINLDIGHFTAANFDPVDYLAKHHQRIITLHIKDRKRNQGDNVPFGQGDTPIEEVLALLKQHKWPIPAMIEYEYKGGDTLEEVKRCADYCRQALA